MRVTWHPLAVRRAVLADLRAKKSTRQAAYRNGVSHGCVVKWAREYGIVLKAYRPLTAEQWEGRLQDIISGMPDGEIMAKHQLSRQRVQTLRSELRHCGRMPPMPPAMGEREHREIAMAPGSAKAVAARFEITVQYVRELRRKYRDESDEAVAAE